jgi:hypothetical protein
VWLSNSRISRRDRRKGNTYLAAGPDEDYRRDAESGLRIPMGEVYEMEVYVRGIVLVSDGPGDDIGGGQHGRVINEGLDDWDFHASRGFT